MLEPKWLRAGGWVPESILALRVTPPAPRPGRGPGPGTATLGYCSPLYINYGYSVQFMNRKGFTIQPIFAFVFSLLGCSTAFVVTACLQNQRCSTMWFFVFCDNCSCNKHNNQRQRKEFQS